MITQELTIRPEANIIANVPENLDLYNVIFEVENEPEVNMGDVDGAAVENNTLNEPVSDSVILTLYSSLWFHIKRSLICLGWFG